MKKFRFYFAAAALTLVTAAVSANSEKLVGSGLYLDDNGTKIQIDNSTAWPGLTTTPIGSQARIISSAVGNPTYPLYQSTNGTVFTPVYSNGF